MSAIAEVLDLVKTGIEGAGLSVEIDRQQDDRIAESEGEIVALSWQGADATTPVSCPSYFWTAQIGIEIWAIPSATETLLERMTAALALISGVFAADNTFGSKFHDSRFNAVTGMDDLAADRGTIGVTATVQYWTSFADITTISTD